jgi:hypothetical protein
MLEGIPWHRRVRAARLMTYLTDLEAAHTWGKGFHTRQPRFNRLCCGCRGRRHQSPPGFTVQSMGNR